MTPSEALNILDRATAEAPLPRIAHNQVIEALKLIQEIINKAEASRKE